MPVPERFTIWRWAVWFGLVSALMETVLASAARVGTQRFLHLSADFVWMVPVANVAIFCAAAAALQWVVRRFDTSTAVRLVLGVFLFLTIIGPVLLVPRVHPWAKVILEAGVAIQGARILAARRGLLDMAVRRTLPWLAVACAGIALLVHLPGTLSARSTEASMSAAATNAPNVLLIVLDTVRAEHLSLYGYQRPTSPRLDQFARSGVVFERAIAPAPWTLPSHASFFTGRFPHELSADWRTRLDGAYPTLAEVLASRGYATVGVTGNLMYTTAQTGLSRGFTRYFDFPRSPETLIADSWLARALLNPVRRGLSATAGLDDDAPLRKKRASEVNDEFMGWLASEQHRPFFAFVNYFDAHAPYIPQPPFDRNFGGGGPMPDLKTQRAWSPRETQRWMDAYDGEVAYVDAQLGRLLDLLKAQHILDNTLVLIVADHGEQFGEHGLFDHANSLYRPLLHVPFIVSFPPRVPSGLRVSEPVTLVNLAATILNLADGTATSTLPGRSLAAYWQGTARPGAEPVISEISAGINLASFQPASKGPMRSVVVNGMHYIRNGDGREELYDFDHDAAEMNDLAGLPESAAMLDEARRALAVAVTRRP